MNAKLFLLAALVGYVLAQSANCPAAPTFHCSASGATCTSSATDIYTCDASQSLFCSAGSCAAIAAPGSDCSLTTPGQCGAGTYACQANSSYTDYECLGRYAMPGQPCTSGDQCQYGNSGGATNSSCVSGSCYGSVGTSCTAPGIGQCPLGSYCSATFTEPGECMSSAADAACTLGGYADRTCPSGYCTAAKKCGNRFVGVSGDTCVNNEDCGENLFCATAAVQNGDSTCRAIVSASGAACTSNAGCANYEYCGCNSARNQVCLALPGNRVGLIAAATAFYTCRAANPKCSVDAWCSECQAATCAYYKARDGSNAGYNPSNQCSLSTSQRAQAALCKGDSSSTSSASTVAVSAIAAFAAAYVILA